MRNDQQPVRTRKHGLGPLDYLGVAALMIGCCAVPTLVAGGIAATAFAAAAAWQAAPRVIVSAMALCTLVAVTVAKKINRTSSATNKCSTPARDGSDTGTRQAPGPAQPLARAAAEPARGAAAGRRRSV